VLILGGFVMLKLTLDGKILHHISGIKYAVDPFVENLMLKSNSSSLDLPKIASKITNLHINRSPTCTKEYDSGRRKLQQNDKPMNIYFGDENWNQTINIFNHSKYDDAGSCRL
jgi:hypothetical protein